LSLSNVSEKIRRLSGEVAGLSTAEQQTLAAAIDERAKEAQRPTMEPAERLKLIERLRAITDAHPRRRKALEAEEDEKRAAILRLKEERARAWSAISELDAAYREERDSLWAQLRATRDPLIDAFIAEMHELLAGVGALQQARMSDFPSRFGVGPVSVDNSESVNRRREALERAKVAADKLSFEALERADLARALDELRRGLPEVENVEELLKSAVERAVGKNLLQKFRDMVGEPAE
jgi:chromosome segregation ATPase